MTRVVGVAFIIAFSAALVVDQAISRSAVGADPTLIGLLSTLLSTQGFCLVRSSRHEKPVKHKTADRKGIVFQKIEKLYFEERTYDLESRTRNEEKKCYPSMT
jgi:hypothetical protein